jgi:ketosteroid isomerase-like protein
VGRRVLHVAAVALLGCAIARADIGAGDLAPETRALVDAWLAAQNQGDFAAYEKLYAKKLTGVRRSGPRTVSLDRAGWMRDRKRMFQKPMKVSAGDLKIAATPASARVTFTQEWESGSYHDRGPKQLVVVREEGAARIAREEMLASEKQGAPEGDGADAFAFVLGKWAILDDSPDAAWEAGAPRMEDDGDPVITSKRATGLPPELAALAGKKLVVTSPGHAPCTATVKELRIVGAVTPHFSLKQEWREDNRSARKQAEEAWALSGKMLAAALDGCSAEDAAFARGAGRAPLPLVLPEKADEALRASAIAQLRKLPSWRALQKDYAADGGKSKWDAAAPGAEVDVDRWELPGRALVTVSAHAYESCAGFGGEVFAVYALAPGGKLTLVGEPGALRPSAALLLDGVPTFFGTAAWSDFGTGLELVPIQGEPRKLSIPYLDCPC